MFLELPDEVFGALVIAVFLPLMYFLAQLIRKVNNAWMAFRLYPLAATINGRRDQGGPYLKGQYQGHVVRVAFSPNDRLSGQYANNTRRFINAFYLELHQVPGQQDWAVRYGQKQGWLNDGPVYAFVHSEDPELTQRLEQAEVLAAVIAVGGDTTYYETVRYNAKEQVLYYTTDMEPAVIPSREKSRQQLDLLVYLAEINRQINPPLSAPA